MPDDINSSAAINVLAQGKTISGVNKGISKNKLDIEDIEKNMAADIADINVKMAGYEADRRNMMDRIEKLYKELDGQRKIIKGQDETISRLNHTLLSHLPHPVDCLVTSWSVWSSCSKTCGGGTSSRGREIGYQPMNNGKACPVLEEEKECNIELCEGKIDIVVGTNINK